MICLSTDGCCESQSSWFTREENLCLAADFWIIVQNWKSHHRFTKTFSPIYFERSGKYRQGNCHSSGQSFLLRKFICHFQVHLRDQRDFMAAVCLHSNSRLEAQPQLPGCKLPCLVCETTEAHSPIFYPIGFIGEVDVVIDPVKHRLIDISVDTAQ